MKKVVMSAFVLLSCCATSLVACGDEDDAGEGNVTVTVYGEEFIELGIPAEEMVDGWSVTFDAFIVTLDEIVVGGVEVPAPGPVDTSTATNGAGHSIATVTVPAGDHTDASFEIGRVELSGSATRVSPGFPAAGGPRVLQL